MDKDLSNAGVARLLRSVAAALVLSGANQFQVRAYESAADGIEHSTSDVKDLWQEGKLDEIPGIGEKIKGHLEELFKTGEVRHFEGIMGKYPKQMYSLLDVRGIGAKTALELSKLGVKGPDDLKKKIDSGELVRKGFSNKLAQKIASGLKEYSPGGKRLLLPYAGAVAGKILVYLVKCKGIREASTLGSLSRMVATVGDLDFAVSAEKSEAAVEWFCKMPQVREVINRGDAKATVLLDSGVHLDLLVADPEDWGSLLQHFTGSKAHNIHLREIAIKKGYSLSEHGFSTLKTGKVTHFAKEEELYRVLGMQTPPPEIREDTGEIEVAMSNKLPKLVGYDEIKGDLHLHSNYPIEPSHDLGQSSMEVMVKKAIDLGYSYIGFSEHAPALSTHSSTQIIELVRKRGEKIRSLNKGTKLKVLNALEVDIMPDGGLALPEESLKTLDYCIAGVHSVHRMETMEMTRRVLKALSNPYVKILAHPSGRLLNKRDSFEMDWKQIFEFCAKENKALEINAYPNRLDLRDDLVKEARKYRVKFVIDTDSHEVSGMDNMKYGVAVARRGWARSEDIVNSWGWQKFAKWFSIN